MFNLQLIFPYKAIKSIYFCYSFDDPSTSYADDSPDTKAVQHDHSYVDLRTCEEKLDDATRRIEYLEGILEKRDLEVFGVQRITSDPQLLNFYTGFSDYETFQAAFRSIEPNAETMIRWGQVQRHKEIQSELQGDVFRNESLPLLDQFFLFLCRVKVGLFEQDLAVRFNVSLSTVSRIFITWANFLYFALGSLLIWPPQSVIQQQMPECFKITYPKTRVILDCTEVKVQTPSSKVLNSESYSNYKSHATFKGLVGITPSGSVSFVSVLYTGSISDKEITKKAGILDLLEKGDEVMVDKGFPIHDMLQEIGCTLVIPPFLRDKGQFEAHEVSSTHQIARLRIHIERAIRRVKEFHIFDGVIPLSLAGSINQVWTVCCLLTNFRRPLY